MGRGGIRKGAGRPKGQGKYNEPTKPIRIPESMISDVVADIKEEMQARKSLLMKLFKVTCL